MDTTADLDFARAPLPGDALHRTLDAFRALGPVAPTRFLGQPAHLISGHAELAAAFRDGERFPPPLMYRAAFEPVVGRSFITMDEDEHRVYRKLATPAFRSRAIERYERDGLEALAHELIDKLTGQTSADLAAGFTQRFPHLVISRLLGLPREREDDFHRWAIGMLSFREDPQNALRCSADFSRYLAPEVAARRREPREDVISELIAAEVEGQRLDDDEIFAHVRLLFPTGGETTNGSLGSLLYALLVHEGAWKWVCEHPEGRAGVVEEILRWEPPTAVLPRMSGSEPTEFAGVEIPANGWVLFGIAGANRDPAVYPDPHRFDLERNPTELLTFGPGLRTCPGMHLARKNLAVALDVLAERLPGLRLLDAEAAQPVGTAIRAPRALRVSLH